MGDATAREPKSEPTCFNTSKGSTTALVVTQRSGTSRRYAFLSSGVRTSRKSRHKRYWWKPKSEGNLKCPLYVLFILFSLCPLCSQVCLGLSLELKAEPQSPPPPTS